MAWGTSKKPCVAGWQRQTRGFWFLGLLYVTSFISNQTKADRGISVRKHDRSHLQHVRLFDTLWIINTRDKGPDLPLPCLKNDWILCCHVLPDCICWQVEMCVQGEQGGEVMGKESTLGKDGRIDLRQILSHLFLNRLLNFQICL